MARLTAKEAREEGDELGAPVVPDAIAFKVALPAFEGPLDLLLHLIREHQLDILDIPIALITEKYLEYLSLMEALNLDVASEFLVMAATLAHLKSRMLLPRQEAVGELEEEDGEDPREALVRRLLEHQKYMDAGEQLGARPVLGRDAFTRLPLPEAAAEGPEGLAEVSVFKLIEAFARVLDSAKVEVREQLLVDRLSISDAIARIGERLGEGRMRFEELFAAGPGQPVERHRVVVTFLAVLEMVRLKLLRVFQEEGGEILLESRGATPAAMGAIGDDYRD